MCRKMKNREILISIYFDVEFNNLKCILPLDNLQVSSLITSDMKPKNYVWSKESKINSPFSVNHVRFRLFSYFSFWFFKFFFGVNALREITHLWLSLLHPFISLLIFMYAAASLCSLYTYFWWKKKIFSVHTWNKIFAQMPRNLFFMPEWIELCEFCCGL